MLKQKLAAQQKQFQELERKRLGRKVRLHAAAAQSSALIFHVQFLRVAKRPLTPGRSRACCVVCIRS